MTVEVRSLRIRLAVTGFFAIYLPALVLASVVLISDNVQVTSSSGEVLLDHRRGSIGLSGTTDVDTGPEAAAGAVETIETSTSLSPWGLAAVIALAPVAAALAWWWSGRAVRPVRETLALQQHLVEEASHELRSPLSVLSTNAEVLLSHPEPDLDLYRQGIERSGLVARRMAGTVEGLLHDARNRARTIERRPTDLVALARDVTETLRPLATERGVELTVGSNGSIRAPIDRSSVERALANLVTNAIEHAPAGSPIEVAAVDEGALARLSVTDRGPGVAAEDRERIFERHWRRSDPGGEGRGLGLAIARQIAEAHGGTLTVESPLAEGRGARFELRVLR